MSIPGAFPLQMQPVSLKSYTTQESSLLTIAHIQTPLEPSALYVTDFAYSPVGCKIWKPKSHTAPSVVIFGNPNGTNDKRGHVTYRTPFSFLTNVF